jgi:hypothetical protein
MTYEGGGEDLEDEVRKIVDGAEVIGEVDVAEVREMVLRKRQEMKARGGEGAVVLPLERFKVTESKEAINIKTISTTPMREKAKAVMAAQDAYAPIMEAQLSRNFRSISVIQTERPLIKNNHLARFYNPEKERSKSKIN